MRGFFARPSDCFADLGYLGREGGPHGIDEYMNVKLIAFGGL